MFEFRVLGYMPVNEMAGKRVNTGKE